MAWVLSLTLACQQSSQSQGQQVDDPALSSKISSCIRALDSAHYGEREASLEELSSLGAVAIRPLAMQIVSGTPESVWRSKQALEVIGIRGDEDTFLKTVNVLKLLFVGANDALTQRISELEIQWRLEQKRTVIAHLKSKGARVIDQAQPFGLMPDMDELIIWQGAAPIAELDGAEQNTKLSAVKVSASRPSPESLREVEKILDASVEENRNRLFGDSSRSAKQVHALPDGVDPEILLQLRMQRRFGVAMGGQIIGRNREIPIDGVTLILDAQWYGTTEDLSRIKGLDDLKRIEIHVDLPADQVQIVSQASSATSIKVTGNEFSTDHFQQIKTQTGLQELEITDRNIRPGELESLCDLPNLVGLSLGRVQLTPETIKELGECKQLMSIAMFEMKLDSDNLEAFARVRTLRMLNLELCKFPIVAYRTLKRERPELEIAFTPQALLGVRGPLDLGDSRCEISQVVPNSGAELGGLKPGDVVIKIDGQPVEAFEDLRLHVAQHQAGDVLSLIVDREGKEVELKIQLTPFEPMD